MRIQVAKNKIKTVFTDLQFAKEAKDRAKERDFKNKYFTLREFCMNCDILTFSELEALEIECLNRINKINIEAAKRA